MCSNMLETSRLSEWAIHWNTNESSTYMRVDQDMTKAK